MLPQPGWWALLRSFIWPKVLARKASTLNPELRLVLENGRTVLNAGTANYSYGRLYDVFQAAFKAFRLQERPFQHALVLGLGAGGVAQQLRSLGHDGPIVGVEHDPAVLELARQHFLLEHIPGLKVVNLDALEFLNLAPAGAFDLVVVDVFHEMDVPAHLESLQAVQLLERALSASGLLLVNRVQDTPARAARTQHFREVLELVFSGQVSSFRMGHNLVLAAERRST